AGATEICVSVRGGGIDKISITDNGCGIDFDDMPTAFLPHATSKIKNLDDLDTISTLGFRGEALPSIGAVADVTMISRTADNEIGGKIVYKGGKLISHDECGTSLGTTVTVENLFEHIPARKKFLSKPSREETKIFTLIEHLVLSNPNIVFKFDSETKHFSSPGEGLKSAVFAVYGDSVLKNTAEVNLSETPITVTGFTCLPTYTKPSRNYQNIIINGRYVESTDIQYAVYSVYSAYLMKRQYPLFVLHITMPYDMVDVNVHPSKMQVKFADTVKIKSIVARAVKNAVMPRLTEPKKLDLIDDDFKSDSDEQYGKPSHNLFKSFFEAVPVKPISVQAPDYSSFTPIEENTDTVAGDNTTVATPIADAYTDIYTPAADFTQKQQVFAPAECKCIGKLFNTYLILERGEQC
ncbi:MAG: DNA mismatch repair endonuclease MutL, partial [Clostridiales bacterium]|nr:DNA mismatch repair endonuclease MutL [Clostridiales bacterium]